MAASSNATYGISDMPFEAKITMNGLKAKARTITSVVVFGSRRSCRIPRRLATARMAKAAETTLPAIPSVTICLRGISQMIGISSTVGIGPQTKPIEAM